MYQKAVLIFSFLVFSSSIFATSWSSDHTYLAKVHYSSVAYGKKVEKVLAHLGVKSDRSSIWQIEADLYWQSVTDIELTESNDGFIGQAILEARSHKFGPHVQRPVVQYWVWFSDGTWMVSDVYNIPIIDNYSLSPHTPHEDMEENVELFLQTPTERTEALAIIITSIS